MELRYGAGSIKVSGLDNAKVIRAKSPPEVVLREKFDQVISENRPDNVKTLIIHPDITRKTGSEKFMPWFIKLFKTRPQVLVSLGLHRNLTSDELKKMLPDFDNVLQHNTKGETQLLGQVDGIGKAHVNKLIFEFDQIVIIDNVHFHYLAGFSGGLKNILPGVASEESICGLHKLSLGEDGRRHANVRAGNIKGNPFFNAIRSVGALLKNKRVFLVNTLIDPTGDIFDITVGDPIESHDKACKILKKYFMIKLDQKADTVIAGCGGFPKDINFIQSHKSIEHSSYALKDGGKLILYAECRDGLGHAQVADWLTNDIFKEMKHHFHPYMQTASSIMEKAARFRISLRAALDDQLLQKIGIERQKEDLIKPHGVTYVIPDAGYIVPYVT